MSRRDDLIALRDAVEAGNWGFDACFIALAIWPDNRVNDAAWHAFRGSTDAALAFLAAVALHDRLVMFRADDGTWGVNLGERDTVFHAVLSVALLLAGLDALIEREP